MFSGWIDFSQWTRKELGRFCKKGNGIYVPDDELVRLLLITFEERRASNVHFDLSMDVRKYGWEGVFRMQNEKQRSILVGNNKGEELREWGRGGPASCEQLELWKGEIAKGLWC